MRVNVKFFKISPKEGFPTYTRVDLYASIYGTRSMHFGIDLIAVDTCSIHFMIYLMVIDTQSMHFFMTMDTLNSHCLISNVLYFAVVLIHVVMM